MDKKNNIGELRDSTTGTFDGFSVVKFLNGVWNDIQLEIKSEVDKKSEQRIQVYKSSEKAWGASNPSKPLITSSNDFLSQLSLAKFQQKQINQ